MLKISPILQKALKGGEPVVALESTVISHGLPYPHNREVTYNMMERVRTSGAHPAVIGLMDGQIVVGLSDEEIEVFATAKNILKVSRADLSFCLQQKRLGATTVSATAFAAHRAGIQIFATGGLGGVHRGAEISFDVSTDLFELSQTPVAVVCSGAKLILDIPKTLEYLETLGVPVVGYGTQDFPLFYARGGPYLQKHVQSPEEAAALIHTQTLLGLKGLIIANPIPEEAALDRVEIEEAIEVAERKRLREGIHGKEVTPFLLKELTHLTQEATLKSNKALLEKNAAVGGEIAVALAGLAESLRDKMIELDCDSTRGASQ